MSRKSVLLMTLYFLLVDNVFGQPFDSIQTSKCRTATAATEQIERIIATCQEEIKLALLKEAIQVFKEIGKEDTRNKREALNEDEQRIAGCLLQCVYKKFKAVDSEGFPTVEGLIGIYAEGISDGGYFLATAQAVQQCLHLGMQQNVMRQSVLKSENKGAIMCNLSYKVFVCISDQLAKYCSGA